MDWPITSAEEYFQAYVKRHKDEPVLPLRATPCEDCAVICGFYKEISDALKRQPQEVIDAVSSKWSCHADSSFACRGNADSVNYKPT